MICLKVIASPGNTCLQNPGTCDSCPLWNRDKQMELDQFLSMQTRMKKYIVNGEPLPKIRRYKDRCYAVVIRNRRGPCGHDKTTAVIRYLRSGLIAGAGTDK